MRPTACCVAVSPYFPRFSDLPQRNAGYNSDAMKFAAEIIAVLVLLVTVAISYFAMQFFVRGPLPELLAVVVGLIVAMAVRNRVRSRG